MGIERLKLDITTNISFGTEIKFKIERTVKHTNIPASINVITKVGRYPHYQFTILADNPAIAS